MYVGGKLVQKAYLGGKKIYPEHGVIPKAIKDAMVLWYDLKKQAATNESMTTTPTLIDHSGNGHDATCYNFAWSGMSGVGGYADSYIETHWYIEKERVNATKTEAKINVTGILSTMISIYYQSNTDEQAYLVPSYKIKVIGLTDGQSITYRDVDNTVTFTISNDGEYTLPEINFAAAGKYYGFVFNKLQDSCNITIEQLPLYPHALVSDGVDDYCLVEGLPLLNKEDGYTVIAKRKWIGNKGCLSHKRDTVDENGAFQFERYYAQGDKSFTNFSFGERTGCPIQIDDITYQTTASYNGNVLNVGDLLDNNFLQLFHYGYNVNSGLFSSIALHSFILFNRDLSIDEIEWVKTNLIETEQ